MTKTYLALALLITVLAGNAYGESEVYYCSEIAANGFQYDNKGDWYLPTPFTAKRFKIKMDRVLNTVELALHDGNRIKFTCGIIKFEPNEMIVQCMGQGLEAFTYNPANGRFSLSYGGGYIKSTKGSLAISYGTCDKF